ncbi:Putative protein of unknown function [Podospora comata]|uniref:Uncharacterized protein n=1 Tax=Podospora comata TaxID=48703 RepID=A0ABY6S6A2_PODCO|nr:Putative protein of unknown function [Podospora comata]
MPTWATTSSSAAPPAPGPSARAAWETVRGEIPTWCRDELSRSGGDFGLPVLDFIFDRVIRYNRGEDADFREVQEITAEERELLDEVAATVAKMTTAESGPPRPAVFPCLLAFPGYDPGVSGTSEQSLHSMER